MKRHLRLLALIFVIPFVILGCSPNNNEKVNETVVETRNTDNINELSTGTFEGTGKGLHGDIKVAVKVNNGEILDIEILEEQENKILGQAAFKGVEKDIIATNSTKVDTVSGATLSSFGYLSAVKNALQSGNVVLTDPRELEIEKVESEQTYDVVVIGAGGAGMSAAIEAAKGGASVVILEKAGTVGGNTVLSGMINAAGTRFQKDLGIPDTAEIMYEDLMKGGDNKSNPDLARILTENSAEALEWAVDYLGLNLHTKFIAQFDIAKYPRAHIATAGTNVALVELLRDKCEELGVNILINTKAKNLLKDGDRVVGVKAETKYGQEINFSALKGVVLATGGFSANFDMVAEYAPEKKDAKVTTNVPSIKGDGIKMAKEIGANLIDMGYIQTNPAGNPKTGELMVFSGYGLLDGGMFVNKSGERFMSETERRDVHSKGILEQEDGIVYIVWGDEVDKRRDNFNENKQIYEHEVKTGSLIKSDSLKECADFFGINYENLEKSLERYNELVEKGVDEDFGRMSNLVPIKTGPYYIASITPSLHHTMGGVEINTNTQVIDTNGNPIEGLFAAGEVTGGIHGTNRLGGNAIADALVFGRLAGQNVIK